MRNFHSEIFEYLDGYQLKHSLAGYRYLYSGIQLGIENLHFTKISDLYDKIALLYDTERHIVEHSIRYLLKASHVEMQNKEFLARAIDSITLLEFQNIS